MTDQQTKPDTSKQDESAPILDLSTLAPTRPTVKIKTPEDPDGALYELRLLEHDFSADDHARFQQDLAEFDRLWSKPGTLVCKTSSDAEVVDGVCREHEGAKCLKALDLTKDEGKRMTMLLSRLLAQVLDAPKAIQAALTDEQKRTVIVTFQYAPVLAEALAQQAAKKEKETDQAASEPSTTGS